MLLVAFLRGLDVQATWFNIKTNGTLLGFNNPNSSSPNDPLQTFHYIVPSDLGWLGGEECDAGPLRAFRANGEEGDSLPIRPNNATAPLNALTNIYWITDGGNYRHGLY